MIHKKACNFDTLISSVGLGTGDYFWNSEIHLNEKIHIIRTAIENGINLIDTAEEYGDGISESIVGEAIRDIRDQVVISSKFSPQNNKYEDILRSCEKSLNRLHADSIDIYQIHWPNPSVPLNETIRALKFLYNEGKIKTIGMCNYSLREIKEAQKYLSEIPLSFLQMEYNLFERTIEKNGIIDYSNLNKILILAYSPLDQGQSSVISPDRTKTLKELGKKYNKTLEQIILNFLISRFSITVLTRTTSQKHLLQNVQAMDFVLLEEDIKLIEKKFPIHYENVPVDQIMISFKGEWNHKAYHSLEKAIENKLNFIPSPIDLANSLKKGDFLKPVRLKRLKDSSKSIKFELVGGRIRFWAWVIAFGRKSLIPSYIREDYLS